MKQIHVIFSALLLAVWASAQSARANDSAFDGVGSTARLMRGENSAIRMVSEKVVLTAQKHGYTTRADFVFRNDSARALKVPMGFPESNSGEEATPKTQFTYFRTAVDGQPIQAKRTVLAQSDSNNIDTYWLKTVTFAPNQTRRVRVEFGSPYGGSTAWGYTRAVAYYFTGGNWRGKVAESTLEIHVDQAGLWRAVARDEKGKAMPFALTMSGQGANQRAVLRRVWKNWEAQQFVTVGLERVPPFWRLDTLGPDNGEFTLQSVAAAQTFRVGDKPDESRIDTVEPVMGFPTAVFTRNGTSYLWIGHLTDRLDLWGESLKPKVKKTFSPTTGFVVRAGKTRLSGKVGQKTMQINGKTVALGAPILSVPGQYQGTMTYLPLAPIARELGLRYSTQGERLFRLERGNWKG